MKEDTREGGKMSH